MGLIDRLKVAERTEESLFRAAFIKEDIVRLQRLLELSRTAKDRETFNKEGVKVGWTHMDARTWELKEALDPFLESFYACCADPTAANNENLEMT